MDRRNTVQKELVLNAVMQMHGHVTADEVYERIHADYPSVGKGTVYRNLGILAGENKIRRIEISGGADRFDYRLNKHFHLRCVKCGGIYDVDMETLPEIEAYMHRESDAVFLDYDILFKGICPLCGKKETEEN